MSHAIKLGKSTYDIIVGEYESTMYMSIILWDTYWEEPLPVTYNVHDNLYDLVDLTYEHPLTLFNFTPETEEAYYDMISKGYIKDLNIPYENEEDLDLRVIEVLPKLLG